MNSSAEPPHKKICTTTHNATKESAAAKRTLSKLSADEIAIIFSFLPPKDILRARVCTTWREAALKTIVPLCEFEIADVNNYNAMRAMTCALPNLQRLDIRSLRDKIDYRRSSNGSFRLVITAVQRNKYVDGDDPDENLIEETANLVFSEFPPEEIEYISYDINIVSNFRKLLSLSIERIYDLNGRYPALFNFPLLQNLVIARCNCFKFDLDMLGQMTSLKNLDLDTLPHLTGDIQSLRALKNTMKSIGIHDCEHVSGNFMDLSDFPHLGGLYLDDTKVTGDIRDIGQDHFPALEALMLPSTVVGGCGYEFQHVSDVPIFMQAVHPLFRRLIDILGEGYDPVWYWNLSEDSPDWYMSFTAPPPPFGVEIFRAGPRLGWSWCSRMEITKEGEDEDESDDDETTEIQYNYCAINWLDPKPTGDLKLEDEYTDSYAKSLDRLKFETAFYKAFTDRPPTEEEYHLLASGREEQDSDSGQNE